LENTQVLTNIQGVLRNDSGATLVEYALVVALIAIACIGTITALGGQIKTAFTTMSTKLAAA
jgi:pilus assembly protein Flp/PilA